MELKYLVDNPMHLSGYDKIVLSILFCDRKY